MGLDAALELLVQALDGDARDEGFTVAGPEQIALLDMLKLLAGGLKVKRAFLPVPLKPVQALMRIYLSLFPKTKLPAKQILELDKHEAFDISATQEAYNFKPRPFREGVERMFPKELCAVS